MLEGLEVSVLLYSRIKTNDFGRIDSEFFLKKYLNSEMILKLKETKTISQISIVTDGEHGSPDLDENSGIIYLSGNNIKDNYIDLDNVRFCSEILHNNNLRSAIKKNNVLMSIVGTVGKASIVDFDILGNTDRNVATIKNISQGINPYYLSIFLNSHYGKYQTERFSTGNVQPLLNLLQVKSIIISNLDLDFQKKIEFVFKEKQQKINKSKYLYTQAEQLLLEELGLKDWQPSTENINSKSFKESFLATGRLDAEYYQPKYEDILNHLQKFNTKKLGDVVDIKKSIEPGSDAYQESGIPFIRVTNISKQGITDTDIHLERSEYQTYELKPKKDTILLSKDGSVGIAYKVEKDLDVITSGALLHLSVIDNEFLPDYLTLVLNSLIVKLQAERDAGGSIIQHWKPSEIEQVVIPLLDIDKQQEISSLIQESFVLKHQSEHLLEVAKRAIEIAIEEDEEKAIEYISQNTKQ